ncbi:MAG: hypothetical protein M3Z85_22600, partial [Acidobacteriota bacterium]|nr:hypothetical protein [Acidobacteriota bacterium]
MNRRLFFQLCSAATAFLSGGRSSRAKAAPPPNSSPVKHRKNFVAIQVKPYAWIDEGTDYGKFDVIRDVARKVHARGMDFFCGDCNNAVPIMNRSIPGFSQVAEVDLYGRPTTSPRFNHPDYRAHLTGKIESYLGGYANEVDGIGWG